MRKIYLEKLKDPRWQKKRLKILERDNFICRICGDDKSPLHVHHIAYSKEPWDIKDDLLITLCETCHQEEEKSLKENIETLITKLKESGFMSIGFFCLSNIFVDKDRGWTYFEPSFDILKMIIDDDILWKQMSDLFWERLNEKVKNKKHV